MSNSKHFSSDHKRQKVGGHSSDFDAIQEEHQDKKVAPEQKELKKYTEDKVERGFYANLDVNDKEQMALLKKRDIKRFRKEMRKLKKDKGPGIQV